ncbi:MAG: hypothetical protein ABI528_07040, partial [bacterium]
GRSIEVNNYFDKSCDTGREYGKVFLFKINTFYYNYNLSISDCNFFCNRDLFSYFKVVVKRETGDGRRET